MATAFCSYHDSTSESGQIVDAALERVGQRQRHLDGGIGIVALPHVQKARERPDLAEILVEEAELAARQREDERILRGLFHKFGVVVAARLRAVAAAHEEDVAHGPGLHRVKHGGGGVQQRLAPEAHGHFLARHVFRESGQFQRLKDEPGAKSRFLICTRPGQPTMPEVNTFPP